MKKSIRTSTSKTKLLVENKSIVSHNASNSSCNSSQSQLRALKSHINTPQHLMKTKKPSPTVIAAHRLAKRREAAWSTPKTTSISKALIT